MSPAAFSVRNPVLVNMLMVVLLAAGGVFALTLVREMFPESRPDKLLVMAVYPGVQPQEVEKAVTIRIEEAVRDIDGIEKIDSIVSEGNSTTVLSLFNEIDDVDAVLQEVKIELDSLQNLPDDIEQLTIRKLEPQLPVISVAIYGDGGEAALKRAVRNLRDDLLTLPGVSNIEITGTRDDEISIEIRPERLLQYDITFDEVAAAIRVSNLDVSGGQLKGRRTTVAVRTLGEETRGMDLEDIVIRTGPDGQRVLLSDVARVHDGFIETDLESRFNGKPSVNCVIYKGKNEDAIRISSVVKAWVAGKRGEPLDVSGRLPNALARLTGRPDLTAIYEASRRHPFDHGFEVALHTDIARFVEGRLDLLTRNGRAGLVLVLISLNLFLNWRVAWWAAVGLVVSFMGTFVAMWVLGASINLLSMFGLIIVLGIIVDDAIVIGENIYRHIEEGEKPLVAAVRGAEEVMWPVIIAIATTIGAFAPLFFIRGQIGDFMGQLPLVVIAALSISLVEALFILPAHLAHMPSRTEQQRRARQSSSAGPVRRTFRRAMTLQHHVMNAVLMVFYERLLVAALRWRYVTISVATATVVLSVGLVAGQIVDFQFIQKMDSESMICNLEMPVGSTSDKLRDEMQKLADHIVDPNQFPEVVNVQSFVARQYDLSGAGATGLNDQSHLGQLIVELTPADQRSRSSEVLLNEFRKYSLAELSGMNSVKWQEMNGGPGGNDIEIRASGRDFDEIIAVCRELKQMLTGLDGVYDLDDDHDVGKRELQLRLRESARPTGITVGMLGSHVRAALFGSEARRITRNREDVKIMVRYPERFRRDVYHVESMWIPAAGATTPARGWIPLREVAELTEAEGYTTIHRSDQQHSMTVFGSVDREVTEPSRIVAEVRKRYAAEIASRYPGLRIEYLGQSEEMAKAFGGLKLAFPAAMLLIYGMLAGLFRSYAQPLVVMSAIPFGFLGAIVGHWITDNPITILSLIGMVALAGILVNDALVLVDFINRRVRQGMHVLEASIQGARLRLRAILLTTLTTVAGLTPLMFETSFQAKFLIPMAVTLTFGLIFATALTLIIVPVLNMIFFDIRSLVRGDQAERVHEPVESTVGV